MIPNRINASDGSRDRDRMAMFRRLQSEYLIFEQDIRKKRRTLEALTAEIRKMKTERSRLDVSIREKQTAEGKLFRDLGIMEAEGGRIKKRMNSFS